MKPPITNSIAVKENEDALAEIKKSGKTTLHTLTDAQRKAWRRAMLPALPSGRKVTSARGARSGRQRTRHQDELTTGLPAPTIRRKRPGVIALRRPFGLETGGFSCSKASIGRSTIWKSGLSPP